MESMNIEINVSILQIDELTPSQRKLVESSRKACDKSYSPYSKFAVGAALELDNGEMLWANNQENAAYPSGLCAERSLLFYAKSNHPDNVILRMAISAKNNGEIVEKPVAPCGTCRQVLLETANRQITPIEIILAGKDKVYIINDVKDLLPLRFDADDLK